MSLSAGMTVWRSRLDISALITHFIHDRNPDNDPDWIYGEGEHIRFPYVHDCLKNSRFDDWYNRDKEYPIEPDGSALKVLLKIIDDGHIKSTWSFRNNLPTVYGPRSAVCFTEMPLYALIEYSRQRGDKSSVQPYGISIFKKDAFKAGARPVIYGLTNNHEELAQNPATRGKAFKMWPRFLAPSCGIAESEQYRYVRFSLTGKVFSDWTHEREWRWSDYRDQYSCPGLPLYLEDGQKFPIIMIFVPTNAEAQQVLDRLKVHYDSGWDGSSNELKKDNLLNTRVIALDQVPNRPTLRLEDLPMQHLLVMRHPKPSIELIEKAKMVFQKAEVAAQAAADLCYEIANKNPEGQVLDVCGFASLMISEPQSELTAALIQLDSIEPLGRLGYVFTNIKYKRPDQGLCIEEAAMQAAKEEFEKYFPNAQLWIRTRWD